jgi:3'(2'), 5'-bisphosphate nucleotidase
MTNIGEEDSAELTKQPELLKKVVHLVNDTLDEQLNEKQVLNAIDLGRFGGGPQGRFWTLDPIDGTKGFLRGGQFAICLALIENGVVQLAIQGCPNLPLSLEKPDVMGTLMLATRGEGAFQRSFDSSEESRITVSAIESVQDCRFCESFEAGHSSHDDSKSIAAKLNITREPIRMDSQCKYGIVARGEADIFLRLPVSMEYEEKIWDHAGGSLLITEAGGKICDIYGHALDFGKGRTMKTKGVIATNGTIHSKVMDAVQKTLGINKSFI